jgi:hypothetical protein
VAGEISGGVGRGLASWWAWLAIISRQGRRYGHCTTRLSLQHPQELPAGPIAGGAGRGCAAWETKDHQVRTCVDT